MKLRIKKQVERVIGKWGRSRGCFSGICPNIQSRHGTFKEEKKGH